MVPHMISMINDFFEHVLFVVSLGTSTQHLVIILVIDIQKKVWTISGSG